MQFLMYMYPRCNSLTGGTHIYIDPHLRHFWPPGTSGQMTGPAKIGRVERQGQISGPGFEHRNCGRAYLSVRSGSDRASNGCIIISSLSASARARASVYYQLSGLVESKYPIRYQGEGVLRSQSGSAGGATTWPRNPPPLRHLDYAINSRVYGV